MRIENKVVEGINQKEDRYGMKIESTWYNGFGDCPAQRGQKVSFDYEDNPVGDRVFHNISKNSIVEIKIDTQPMQGSFGKPGVIKGTENEQKRELAVKKVACVLYNKREFDKMSFAEICKIVDETVWK